MQKWLSTNNIILILILASSFTLMLGSSVKESATMDELAHIPAGYGYVRYLDFRLNPEHPPLAKAIAAFPLLFQDLKFPTDKSSWINDVNGQWVAGAQFLYEKGNDADKIINWSRIGPMFLMLILVIFVYIWAKEIIGKWWAFMPTILTAISPNFLAHGHYVTTDIAAALGFFFSIYYFVKFLQNQKKRNLIYAGVAFGLAQLLKFSLVLVIPLFVFLIIAFAFYKASRNPGSFIPKLIQFVKQTLKLAGSLILIFVVGGIVIYAVYFIFTINYPVEKQLSDTTFILASFADGPGACPFKITEDKTGSNPMRCLADLNIAMTKNSITRPAAEYMLGVLMVMQRSSGGNTGYFLGEVSAAGWWYYFPVIFILKEPLPSLIIIAFALLLAILKFISKTKSSGIKNRFTNYLETNFAEFSMLSFIVLYWAYSIKSPLNIGVRHILPTLPFIYILSAQSIKNWTKVKIQIYAGFFRNFLSAIVSIIKNSTKISVVLILMVWFIMESLTSYPYFISYFNQFGGGTLGGYKYVTDSNYDWGQDLKRLKTFVDNPPSGQKINKIAVDYFGGGSPTYYLSGKAIPWHSARGNPVFEGIDWIAVSVNSLQGALGQTHPNFERKPEDEYLWLSAIKDPYKPDYRIGTSIFVYKLK